MNETHVGSDFDDFVREEGLLEEVEAVATGSSPRELRGSCMSSKVRRG